MTDDGTPGRSEDLPPSEPNASAAEPHRARRRVRPIAGIAGIGVLAAAVAVVAVTLGEGSHGAPSRLAAPTPSVAPNIAAPTTSPTTTPAPPCPLSGLPAPDGLVPQRPALAIKVDNYRSARPQSGLNDADIVFEEPVEGDTTRLVAVFQCVDADAVGDIRSARAVDAPLLDLLSTPLFVHVGGIAPVLSLIRQANVIDEAVEARGYPVQNPPGRYAPYDTYVSTAAAWGLRTDDTQPPAPLFNYSTTSPPGRPVTRVHIPFSATNDATWTWDPTGRQWMLSYSGVPATLADGGQVRATNVVVEVVKVTYGPWTEDGRLGLEVQSQLIGTGPLVVFRNGLETAGSWQRTSINEPTRLFAADGTAIALQPGETWVEIVPSTIAVTTTSGPTSAPAA